jgi:beta-N-acetylhexosaminidase
VLKVIIKICAFILSCSFFANVPATQPTLNEKIGQMIMIGFDGTVVHKNDPVVKDILAQRIVGVILFDYNFRTKIFDRNIKSPKQLKALINQLQNYSKYPLLIGIDYEGGNVARLDNKYGFPKTLCAEYLGKQPLYISKKYAAIMANTMKSTGINLDFAPVVDLDINKKNPVIAGKGRSFSESPNAVINRAKIFADTYKKYGILCTLKHFPGHGSSIGDTHKGFVDVSTTWQPRELVPYQKLAKSCNLIMTAHVVNKNLDKSGMPASLSYNITAGLLRNKIGFKGVIITDDLQMGAIAGRYTLEDTVKLAIQAGADILLFGNSLNYQPHIAEKVIAIVDKLIKKGVLSQDRIDESYNRIIAVKKNLIS